MTSVNWTINSESSAPLSFSTPWQRMSSRSTLIDCYNLADRVVARLVATLPTHHRRRYMWF